MTPQRKMLKSSTPRQLPDLPPADLNTAINEPPTPRPELLSPKVTARRVGVPSLKKRDLRSRQVDYANWDLKYNIKFGKVWDFKHPTDEDECLIIECCKAKDKWGDQVKNYLLYSGEDEIFRWFTPPGEWWNWLSTFQNEPSPYPVDQKRCKEWMSVQLKSDLIYATEQP